MQNLELRNQRCKPRKTRINTDFNAKDARGARDARRGKKVKRKKAKDSFDCPEKEK